jgi:ABC-type multidrug transport system permease subunit
VSAGTLAAAIGKDVRLLLRDRVGLVFLTVAPVVVITVAGLSLASLYDTGPRGATAFVVPFVDEDGGPVARALADRLAGEPAVILRRAADRDAARAMVRAKQAAVALVVPAGTSAALADGRTASLVVWTDPVRAVELANVRTLIQELRHGIETTAAAEARQRLEAARRDAEAVRAELDASLDAARHARDAFVARLAAARALAARRAAAARADTRRTLVARRAAAEARLAALVDPLQRWLADLEAAQRAFGRWLAEVRARAGRFADRVPPPPTPPPMPPAVRELQAVDPAALAARLFGDDTPELPGIALPALPAPPTLDLPALPAPPAVTLPGTLDLEETSVTGAPARLNTFDQNVPGFSVTFLLLGALLGISLGLLDERDWGTLERLRATPTPLAVPLVAKLTVRAAVGLVQMALLFLVGWLVFGVSLGSEPWGLALPTTGIVLAGTAFGLVVAGVTVSREAVLPVGSIVILTMAATGGCWWPIDLEPRWMRTAALAFPTTWAMDAYNDLMIRRQPAASVVPATLVLLGHAAAYLALGLVLFHRRVRRAG